MMKSFGMVVVLVTVVNMIETIVNPNNETTQSVIYLQKPNELGPRSWSAGISCLDHISSMYMKKKERITRPPNIVLTSLLGMTKPADQIQEGFLKVMMEAISESPPKHTHYQLRIVSDSKRFQIVATNPRELVLADFYVMVVDSLKRLKKIMQEYVIHMVSWNAGAKFLILYNNAENRNNERETAKTIFAELLSSYYVHNVVLLYAIAPTKYTVLLMDYYNASSCRHLKIREVAECQEDRVVTNGERNLELELDAFFNSISLHNCTFSMCATISAPFVEADCIHGLELRIIGFIKNRLKFDIKSSCESENRGVSDDFGNWSGLLGRLNERACDFVLGGFYPDNDVLKSFWVSDSYLQESYTWFSKLADPRPAWMALYAIFDEFSWLTFAVMLAITWLMWYMVVNLLPEPLESRELSLTGINSLAISICVSVNERPICGASRILFLFLAIYGLNVTSIYTSKLISVFTNPGLLHQIDTLDEVVEAGIPFGGNEECRDWFENKHDMWIFNSYNYSENFEPVTKNLEYVRIGERVIMSSRSYILQNHLADDIYAFPQNVFSSPIQMIMKPGFPFLYEFNFLIRRMRDIGIFAKISNDFIYNNTYLNRIAKMRPVFETQVIVLTTEHLQGPFVILVVGVGFGTTLFIGELLTFYVFKPCFTQEKVEQMKIEKSKKKRKQRRKVQELQQNKKFKKLTSTKEKKEILVPWNDTNIYKVSMQKGVRFTPLKRRIINLETT